MKKVESYIASGKIYPIEDLFGYPDSLIRARTESAYKWGIVCLPITARKIIDLGSCHGHGIDTIRRNLDNCDLLISADRWIDYLDIQRRVIGNRCTYLGFDFKNSLPLANKSIDVAFLIHVVEHLDKPENCLREIHRVLSEDGVCLLATPNINNLVHMNSDDKWSFLGREVKELVENCDFKVNISYLNADSKALRVHRIKRMLANIPGTLQIRRLLPWKVWDKLTIGEGLTCNNFQVGNRESTSSLDILANLTKI